MKFRIPAVKMRQARYVQMTFAAVTTLVGVAILLSMQRSGYQQAQGLFVPLGIYLALIGLIEWRIRIDGFDAICKAAHRLTPNQKRELVTFLTVEQPK